MPHLYDLNPHLAPKNWKGKTAKVVAQPKSEEEQGESSKPQTKRGRPRKVEAKENA